MPPAARFCTVAVAQLSAPATIDLELGRAAFRHPHAGTVEAEVAALDARAVGDLPRHGHATGAAEIDGTEAVLVVLALADDVEARIPARARMPAATVAVVTVAAISVVTVVPAGLDEAARATAIHPDAAAIEIPVLPADAVRVGQLVDQSCIAPVDAATRAAHVVALALDAVAAAVVMAVLRLHGRCRGDEEQCHCSQSCQTVCHEDSP